jgi:hypothetical protein
MGHRDGYTHIHMPHRRHGVSLRLGISYVGFGARCLLKM